MIAEKPEKVRDSVEDYLLQCAWNISQLDQLVIHQIVDELVHMWDAGGTVYLAGNGGSAASASHIAVDLMKCINVKLAENTGVLSYLPFRARSMTDSAPLLTCIGNDLGYQNVFVTQLAIEMGPADVLIVISGSGRSPNVLEAAKWARAHKFTVISLTGFDGGELPLYSAVNLHVPVNDMQIAEDCHMAALHLIFREVMARLVKLADIPRGE